MIENAQTDTLADRLIWARETAGLSIMQAAKVTGIHARAIAALEAGNELILSAVVESLAIAYDVDSTWLNTGVGREFDMPDMPMALAEERESLRRLIARGRQNS